MCSIAAVDAFQLFVRKEFRAAVGCQRGFIAVAVAPRHHTPDKARLLLSRQRAMELLAHENLPERVHIHLNARMLDHQFKDGGI